jgi:hypothetical protein
MVEVQTPNVCLAAVDAGMCEEVGAETFLVLDADAGIARLDVQFVGGAVRLVPRA